MLCCKLFQNGISPYCQSIWDSVVTLNHQILPDDTQLDSSGGGGGGKKGKKHREEPSTAPKTYQAEIYAQLVGNKYVVSHNVKSETYTCTHDQTSALFH